MQPAIVVLGSLNMDFVVGVERLPAPGETALGRDFQMIPGGKGANQACAAGKLSKHNPVRMVGRVGYDVFADQLKASLAAAGVDVSAVAGTQSQPTGVALIWVDKSGQNSIVVAAGANHAVAPADLESFKASFKGAAYALFQLETPLAAVRAGLDIARREGAKTILDPAPAQPLPADMLALVDILTPNESEACILLGRPPCRVEPEEAARLAQDVLAMGPGAVLLKLGDRGCLYRDQTCEIWSPAFPVKPVDTTAAGDTFNGALAVALGESLELGIALRFANAAAALSVTRVGAQASIPLRADVERLLGQAE